MHGTEAPSHERVLGEGLVNRLLIIGGLLLGTRARMITGLVCPCGGAPGPEKVSHAATDLDGIAKATRTTRIPNITHAYFPFLSCLVQSVLEILQPVWG